MVALKYGTLQLITAIEAVHHYGLDPARTVLVAMESLIARPDVGSVPWAAVRAVSDRARGPRWWRKLVRQRRFVRAVVDASDGRPVDDLFLGLYSPESCAVAHAIAAGRVTLLDDGTSTVYRSARRAVDLRAGRRAFGNRLTALARRVVGVDTTHVRPLRFFTVFRPELLPGDRHDPCELELHASRLAELAPRPDLLWVLGSNVADAGHLDRELYVELVAGAVAAAAADMPGLVTEYHPHPREDRARSTELARRLGMRLVESPDPIESRLLSADALPGAGIVSFPSSALVSVARLTRGSAPCRMISVQDATTWTPAREVEATVIEQSPAELEVLTPDRLLRAEHR